MGIWYGSPNLEHTRLDVCSMVTGLKGILLYSGPFNLPDTCSVLFFNMIDNLQARVQFSILLLLRSWQAVAWQGHAVAWQGRAVSSLRITQISSLASGGGQRTRKVDYWATLNLSVTTCSKYTFWEVPLRRVDFDFYIWRFHLQYILF